MRLMALALVASAALSAAAGMAATKKAELTTEWAGFATMPAVVGQVTARLSELTAMRRLPAGLSTKAVNEATTSLGMTAAAR